MGCGCNKNRGATTTAAAAAPAAAAVLWEVVAGNQVKYRTRDRAIAEERVKNYPGGTVRQAR
jgi:hypothetical protein